MCIITATEFGKRLAVELQLPQRYGERLVKAYSAVLEETLGNGEGVNLGPVKLSLYTYPTREHTNHSLVGKLRERMYKVRCRLTKRGKELLADLTKRNFNDF